MAERNTPMKDAEVLSLAVAASTKIEAGKMVARNSSGYAVEASDAASIVAIGRAEETADNSSGANGAINVRVRRKKAFKWKNSGTNAVTIAYIGSNVVIEDDETVSINTTNDIVAGKCVGVDSDGVWVETP